MKARIVTPGGERIRKFVITRHAIKRTKERIPVCAELEIDQIKSFLLRKLKESRIIGTDPVRNHLLIACIQYKETKQKMGVLAFFALVDVKNDRSGVVVSVFNQEMYEKYLVDGIFKTLM